MPWMSGRGVTRVGVASWLFHRVVVHPGGLLQVLQAGTSLLQAGMSLLQVLQVGMALLQVLQAGTSLLQVSQVGMALLQVLWQALLAVEHCLVRQSHGGGTTEDPLARQGRKPHPPEGWARKLHSPEQNTPNTPVGTPPYELGAGSFPPSHDHSFAASHLQCQNHEPPQHQGSAAHHPSNQALRCISQDLPSSPPSLLVGCPPT